MSWSWWHTGTLVFRPSHCPSLELSLPNKKGQYWQCFGFASLWWGSEFDLSPWCGSGFWFLFDADPYPDPMYILACHLQIDADPDPVLDLSDHFDSDLDPDFYLMLQIQISKMMRIHADPDPWCGCGSITMSTGTIKEGGGLPIHQMPQEEPVASVVDRDRVRSASFCRIGISSKQMKRLRK